MAEGLGIRSEDARLLRGEGRYTDDLAPPEALRAVVVRSPYAHAVIAGIDTEAARALPGVAAVLTAAEMAGLGSIAPLVRRKGPDGGPMALPPRPPLTGDVARYVGDPVALVLAETLPQAEDAAEAVVIDWEEAEAVTDLVAAVTPVAPQVWPEAHGNVAYIWDAGDEEETRRRLAAAAHVVELSVHVSRTTASPLEPRAVLAEHDPITGSFRLTTGLQAPWQARGILAGVLGVPAEQVEVVVPDVGGSFGLKGQTFPEYAALLYAARLLGRPVHWRATRSESLLADDQGRDVRMTGLLGLDAAGRIVALAMEGETALGAYLSTRGTLTTVDNVPGICGPYRVPAAHARMRGVHTHTPSISPYRGAGRPEASLLVERLIDVAARRTDRDPAALRRLNMLRPEELPHRTPLGFDYDCGDFGGALDRALELADQVGFPDRRDDSARHGRFRGLGMASVIARSANGQFEAARATLHSNGTLTLAVGAVSHGQGHASVLPEIAARVLGVPASRIALESGRSTLFEQAVGTFGSRTAGIAGPAVADAARALLEALRPEAARHLNAGAEEVRYDGDAFVVRDGARLSLTDLAARLGASVSAEGRFAPEAPTFPNGAHVCEVEVDPETGATKVVRYTVVEDVGTVLHPAVVKGQVQGGVAQGLAQARDERVEFDAAGQPLTGSFMDFVLPRAVDLPMLTVESRPVPTARNPLGVKGAGEGGTIGALPAYQNALADALAALGVEEVPMPATAEAVWRLIRAADAAAAHDRCSA